MRILQRRPLVLVASLALALVLAGAAVWATSAGSESLPATGSVVACFTCHNIHEVEIDNFGTLQEVPLPGAETNQILAEVGKEVVSKSGRRTVPLYIRAIGGRGLVEGVGETRFWLDPTRPATSVISGKYPGKRFPAVQEMRFNFFYTTEAFPGRIFRSVNLAVMRSDNLLAFPPRPNTHYHLVAPVELEDVSQPGVVVGRVVANEAVVVPNKPSAQILEREGR